MFVLSPFSGDTCLEPPRSMPVLPVAGSLVTGDQFLSYLKGTPSGLLSLALSRSRCSGSNASPAPPPNPKPYRNVCFQLCPWDQNEMQLVSRGFSSAGAPRSNKAEEGTLVFPEWEKRPQLGESHQTLLALFQGTSCHHLCPLLLLSFRNSATQKERQGWPLVPSPLVP